MGQHRCLLQRRVSIQSRYTTLSSRRRQTIWQQTYRAEQPLEPDPIAHFAIEGTLIVQIEYPADTVATQRIPTHAVLAASSAEDAAHRCKQQVLEAVGLDAASIVWWDTLKIEQA